jgi:hypothetical protein
MLNEESGALLVTEKGSVWRTASLPKLIATGTRIDSRAALEILV